MRSTASEEVRKRSRKSDKVCIGRRSGWIDGQNDYGEIAVNVGFTVIRNTYELQCSNFHRYMSEQFMRTA